MVIAVLIAGATLAAAASRGDLNRILPYVITGVAIALFFTFAVIKRRST